MGKVYGHRECKSLAEVVSKEEFEGRVTPIENGGTGATTARAAEYEIHKNMAEATSAISDEHLIVYKSTAASRGNGALIYKSAAALWTYIAGKIRGAFGFSSSNILPVKNGGTGAASGAAACENIGAVKKTGDTMSGSLNITKSGKSETAVIATNDAGSVALSASYSRGLYDNGNKKWVVQSTEGSTEWAFHGKATNVSGVVAVANGGTGSGESWTALKNLGLEIDGGMKVMSSGSTTVSFGVKFSKTPAVVLTPSSAAMGTLSVSNVSSTGFTINIGGNSNSGTVYWMAIARTYSTTGA